MLASLFQWCDDKQTLLLVTFFAGVLFLLPALRPAPGLAPPCAIVSLLYQFATAAVQVDVTFAASFFNRADEDSGITVVFVDFPASAVGYESKFTQFLDAVENRCVTHCLSPSNIYAAVRSWGRLRNIFTRQASCFALKFLRRVVKPCGHFASPLFLGCSLFVDSFMALLMKNVNNFFQRSLFFYCAALKNVVIVFLSSWRHTTPAADCPDSRE